MVPGDVGWLKEQLTKPKLLVHGYDGVWPKHSTGLVEIETLPEALVTRTRSTLRGLMSTLFFVAGVMHFVITRDYLTIMPSWVPAQGEVVLFTGVCEVLGSVGLLIAQVRKLTGVMLAIFLVCVFPANINMALNHIPVRGHVPGWGYHGPRLAFQPILIWWALFCAEVIDWPLSKAT